MILSFRHLLSAVVSCWLLLAPGGAVRAHDRPAHLTEPAKPTSTMVLRGRASWYGREFQGARTASGERYNRFQYTCAHKTLPFGTRLRVTNPANGKSVVVRVTDRGPFRHQRIIDLSEAAARPLNIVCCGAASVIAEVVPATTPLGPTKAPANLLALQGADPAPQAPFTTYEAPAAGLIARRADEAGPVAATAAAPVVGARIEPAPPSYLVQAGTFAEAANARAVQARLRSLDPKLDVRVVDETIAGRPLSRVLIVNCADRLAAENLRRRLQLWGIGGLVRDVAQL